MGAEAQTLTRHNAEQIATWCGGLCVIQHDALDDAKTSPSVNVPTAQGIERAQVGDTVLREHNGQFRIVKNIDTHLRLND